MSYEELRVVIVVYVSALLPIYILFFRMKNHPLQKWLKSIYAFSFLTCALSWELWFTYGWINGDSVSNRRSDSLNTIIPQDINWLLNSMADAGAISIGGIVLIWLIFKKQSHFFESWNWQYFIALLTFTLSQNILLRCFFILINYLSENHCPGHLFHHSAPLLILNYLISMTGQFSYKLRYHG